MGNNIQLPTRFENLRDALGEKVPQVLERVESDLTDFADIAATIVRSNQGKIVFLNGESGIGKSTFLFSLPIFLSDTFGEEKKIPYKNWKLKLADIPQYIDEKIGQRTDGKITIVTLDRRESVNFDENEFRGLMTDLNGLLRDRRDLLIVWPVTSKKFAEKAISSLRQAGGSSALASKPILDLQGLDEKQYTKVLNSLLFVRDLDLSDISVEQQEVENLTPGKTIGEFLESVNRLVEDRQQQRNLGVKPPEIVFVLSSRDTEKLLGICKGLRRSNMFYLEASRLLDNTDGSSAKWWKARATDKYACLPAVIKFFEAKVVCLSPNAVVHSALLKGTDELSSLVTGANKNMGTGISAMKSTEFVKFFQGKSKMPKAGRKPTETNLDIYDNIQVLSKEKHRDINVSIMELVNEADGSLFDSYKPEKPYGGKNGNILTDIYAIKDGAEYALEFHHKSDAHCNENKISIYILDKLQAYALAYGLATP